MRWWCSWGRRLGLARRNNWTGRHCGGRDRSDSGGLDWGGRDGFGLCRRLRRGRVGQRGSRGGGGHRGGGDDRRAVLLAAVGRTDHARNEEQQDHATEDEWPLLALLRWLLRGAWEVLAGYRSPPWSRLPGLPWSEALRTRAAETHPSTVAMPSRYLPGDGGRSGPSSTLLAPRTAE